jgi:hypothetical protein
MKLVEITQQQAKDALAKAKGLTIGDIHASLMREANEFCELYDPTAVMNKGFKSADPIVEVKFTKDGVEEKFIKYLEQLGRGYTNIPGSWTVVMRMSPVRPR